MMETLDDNDPDDEEDKKMDDEPITNKQGDDRANILMMLEEIDPRFLDFKPVENLTIDFTEGYASSIDAQQPTITPLLASSSNELLSDQKFTKKRGHSDESSARKKKKTS
ncbi:unnamed protein product [Rotaria sordida]|uniref:Uncharacterized protein n=1 Tax=Rotaria sordida TaxID=392033 RepID=A0A814CNI9_9BILA|nr:unnamed protein product [Rotaria sordida]